MNAWRFVILSTLAGLMVSTGCESYCRNHYPCPQPVVASAPACAPCCNPCCPSGYAPTPAVPAAPPAWSAPRPATCCQN